MALNNPEEPFLTVSPKEFPPLKAPIIRIIAKIISMNGILLFFSFVSK